MSQHAIKAFLGLAHVYMILSCLRLQVGGIHHAE